MKRDVIVTISLVILGGLMLSGLEISGGPDAPWWFHLIFWPFLLASLRAMILWFQTLIDAARPRDRKEARMGWIVAHLVLGPLAAYPYYYLRDGAAKPTGLKKEEDLKRRANEGTLR